MGQKTQVALLFVALAGCAPPGVQRPPPSVEAIRAELGDVEVQVVADLFFVACDGGKDELRRCAATVERMSKFLWADFFEKRPAVPVRIYCLRDARSYEEYVTRTYGRPPSTPYGFYMHRERTAVMNIATGTGTLAHVLVYPMLEADLPAAPEWFRAGFAALYEESNQTVDGAMEGHVNWRLRGLKEAMAQGRAPSIATVLSSREPDAAAARYLCLWFQDRGLLRELYRALRNGATVQSVARMDLDELDRRWREWVRPLK